jgi:arylformamidase
MSSSKQSAAAAWNDPNLAYANAAFIPGGNAYPARWTEQAAAFRAACGDKLHEGLPYGAAPRQKLDLFLPQSQPKGLFVFVHGGYWIRFGRESWSHLAAGALAHGWACSMPSYTLAPDASIADMTTEILASIKEASKRVAGPVVVAGHSAGGHLAARMACADVQSGVLRSVPISPLTELAPLMETDMQQQLRFTHALCLTESPARLAKQATCEVHVLVGGDERPAFLWHARHLAESWSCPWTVLAGKHHFDVIDDLADPASAMVKLCLGI